jgi:hypothetical protein
MKNKKGWFKTSLCKSMEEFFELNPRGNRGRSLGVDGLFDHIPQAKGHESGQNEKSELFHSFNQSTRKPIRGN